MSQQHIPCTNCGAPMVPEPDGRTYACRYCHTRIQVAVEAHQIAAGLRLDLANADNFLVQLATLLRENLEESTKISAEGGRVLLIELNLDPHLFVARREVHGVVTQYKKLVRGIALKTVTHPVDRWVELLSKALADHSNTNARAATALSRLRGE